MKSNRRKNIFEKIPKLFQSLKLLMYNKYFNIKYLNKKNITKLNNILKSKIHELGESIDDIVKNKNKNDILKEKEQLFNKIS